MVVARRPLETSVERRVARDALTLYGVVSFKLTLRHDAGWPDRLFLVPGGRPLFIEFKRPGEPPNPLQAHRIETLSGLGYDVEVRDDYDAALAAIAGRLR